ncbi:leucine-rich repeat flightless-interacting protein 1-like [Erinaceus europaeus]|uniref:Leucine-rich repeat flightless-interacting protein 1-like n=1 Tax=Erinaceus europaeus TaxID=9365 RepID=A0ABM3WVJ7_ERIEU|nr:leucine-rich repeat flightless-interacting protein 1-like [Erinaceus europaeus]
MAPEPGDHALSPEGTPRCLSTGSVPFLRLSLPGSTPCMPKHGIILHSEAATSREMSHTLKDGSCPGPSTVTEEELNTLKAMSDGTLGRAPEAEATEAAVAEVGSKILPSSEQERPPEAPEGPVLPPAQDHTSAASEDGAPSPPGTLDRAPAPDAASPDSAAEAEPRGARTPPGAGTGTSPESDGRGGASRDPEAGQGGAQASPSETPSEGVTEEQEGGSPGGAVPQEPPESQRAGSTDGGPGANPTGDMQENQGAGGGGHVASGPAGREEEERGAITPQELAPSGDPPGAHEEEQSEPCGDVRDSSQKKSKSRKKKNRKKKATAAAGAGKGAEKQLSFESTGSSHAEEDAQGTPAGEPGAGTQGQGAETTAQRERADCPEDPSPERDGRDGPGTQDSDTGEATANGDTVSCAGKGAESPATSRAVSSGDGGEEGTSRGHGIPPESEDELDDQGPWEDAVDAPPLEGVAGLSQPISRQGLESISLDSEDLSPDSEPQGLRPQGQQEAGGGSEMGKSKEDCALC